MNQFQNNAEETQQSKPQQKGRRINRRAVLLTIALFILVVGGMFAFAFMQQNNSGTPSNVGQNNDDASGEYANITRIDGKHFYIDGVHTVVGEIAMPTPCDLLESSATVAESAPEQITLQFDVVNNAEFCAQTVTPQRFKVSASASPEATFHAVFEGREVELNLVEAEEGETPDDFELFIKG